MASEGGDAVFDSDSNLAGIDASIPVQLGFHVISDLSIASHKKTPFSTGDGICLGPLLKRWLKNKEIRESRSELASAAESADLQLGLSASWRQASPARLVQRANLITQPSARGGNQRILPTASARNEWWSSCGR